MKFSDLIIASAFLFVASLWLLALIVVPFIPLKNYMSLVAGVISGLIISIIVGYLFALKIKEDSKLQAIGSIVLLATAGFMIWLVGWSANPLISPVYKDTLQSIFSTGGWTDYDWFGYTAFLIALEILIFALVNFVGLYVGSMLNRRRI